MKAKSQKKNMATARARSWLGVIVFLAALAPLPAASAGTTPASALQYIDTITADLDAAGKNRDASVRKLDRIKAFRAGLVLPKDAPADAKALEAQKVAEEALKKTDETIARLEKALPIAEKEMLKSVSSLAKRLKWSADEQARLSSALDELDFDGDSLATVDEKKKVWDEMLSRPGGDFALEASLGFGPDMQSAGAGKQTEYNDCAIFALANAAGVPYGVAANRAAELISQAEWRPPGTRENPRDAIEKNGLNGAEAIFMAEAMGEAQVVKSSDFERVLKEGRPVLANVAPRNGATGGHQVVITKTFKHSGATWYEMMDSNQGPVKRLYLSADELGTILQENGVAFRPEPGRKPALLR